MDRPDERYRSRTRAAPHGKSPDFRRSPARRKLGPRHQPPRDRPTMHDMATPRLEMRQITKSFGGVHALSGVTLKAGAGEVHALCGENGAGKSTLMKILAGAITDYGGEILLDGKSRQILRTQGRGGRRDPDHLPGIEPRPRALRRGQPVPRPREDRPVRAPRRPGDGGERPQDFRAPGDADLAPGPGRRPPDRRPADGRDRQGPRLRSLDPDHGRAHVGPLRRRGRAALPGDQRPPRRGLDDPLHLAQDERGVHPLRRRDRPPRRPVRRRRPQVRHRARPGDPVDGRPRDRRAALRPQGDGGQGGPPGGRALAPQPGRERTARAPRHRFPRRGRGGRRRGRAPGRGPDRAARGPLRRRVGSARAGRSSSTANPASSPSPATRSRRASRW